jgi:RNA polymerase sigma-70 factor (TIGR02960 family)
MPSDPQLLQRSQQGDRAAFAELVAPYRRELHVHCYRMLGSYDDAEDALQDTLLAAWRGIGGFRTEASIRTWLYRVATNVCLNHRRTSSRRPQPAVAPPEAGPAPNGTDRVTWLQPYPDALLDELPASTPGPEATVETREAVSLAFVVAVQTLSPRGRAVLVLRDVIGFTAREVAVMLGTSADAVATQLSRARAAMRAAGVTRSTPGPPTPDESALGRRFAAALIDRDVDAVVGILTEDIRIAMPPLPYVWTGLPLASQFLADIVFPPSVQIQATLTAANRQPALAVYSRRQDGDPWKATGLLVLTVRGNRIAAVTRFEPDRRFESELGPGVANRTRHYNSDMSAQ